ncbi:hypothetical protein [Cohnella sp. GbtcB17]|uniref:hypothetical protein n=1 Tax=Cohnella sp. GbtcB17 TaxID=2824762 RepID=UPI001C2F22F8|nr:hypothetical protein [Cohnella sp. GbtcB17]
MPIFRLEENDIQNLLTFLSRLKYDGADHFAEVEAVQRIRLALTQPVNKESE